MNSLKYLMTLNLEANKEVPEEFSQTETNLIYFIINGHFGDLLSWKFLNIKVCYLESFCVFCLWARRAMALVILMHVTTTFFLSTTHRRGFLEEFLVFIYTNVQNIMFWPQPRITCNIEKYYKTTTNYKLFNHSR